MFNLLQHFINWWVLLFEKAYALKLQLSIDWAKTSWHTTVCLSKHWHWCKVKIMTLPWALLCLHIVCWWCLRCWPTWSDKSCSTWRAEAAREASHPVSSATGRKEAFLSTTVLLKLWVQCNESFCLHCISKNSQLIISTSISSKITPLIIKCNPRWIWWGKLKRAGGINYGCVGAHNRYVLIPFLLSSVRTCLRSVWAEE